MEPRGEVPNANGEPDEADPLFPAEGQPAEVFVVGAMVVVTLNAPREKFWGAILALNPAGLSIRGVGLTSFDDFIRQVKAGESAMGNVVFFPMHRIERLEIDARNFDIPSLAEGFEAKTGHKVSVLLGPQPQQHRRPAGATQCTTRGKIE